MAALWPVGVQRPAPRHMRKSTSPQNDTLNGPGRPRRMTPRLLRGPTGSVGARHGPWATTRRARPQNGGATAAGPPDAPAGRASRPARLRFQPGEPRAGKSARRAHALAVRDFWPGCECRGLAPRRLRARRRRRSPFWGRKWRAPAALGGLWRARGQAHAPGTRRAGPGRWFRAACAGFGRVRARTRAPRPPQAATGATLGGLLGRFREGREKVGFIENTAMRHRCRWGG